MWFRASTSKSNLVLGLGYQIRRWYSSGGVAKRFAALWGNGDYGRLGLGSLNSQWRPVVCSAFNDDSIRAIACGGAHTLFLTESGRVYASGLNDSGQLGISDDESYRMEPVEVSGIHKEIKEISAGYSHSCAITVDGELYIWGNNSSGQLGLGKRAPKVVSRPVKVEFLNGMTIKVAALGSVHSIAVTDEGVSLSWGDGGFGRLGHGHQPSLLGFLRSSSEYTPRLIKVLEGVKVKSVAAGLLHSACISGNLSSIALEMHLRQSFYDFACTICLCSTCAENGSVFMFGERALNNLSLGKSYDATTPQELPELPSSDDVSCGGYHTCVVTSGRELYTWGSNENGCLGVGCTYAVHFPERVHGPFMRNAVFKVSCGWKHTAAISDGQVFTWGWGGSHGTFSVDGHSSGGQLGHGTDVDYIEPTKVDFGKNVKALAISCGFNHTGAILEYL